VTLPSKVVYHISKSIACSFREVALPLCLSSVIPYLDIVSSLGLPSKGKYFYTDASPAKTIELVRGLEYRVYEERLRELGLFCPVKR